MERFLELLRDIKTLGCSCDAMSGYQCGIHWPLAELEKEIKEMNAELESYIEKDAGASI